ncbi:MAG TPA: hypothetical protein VMV86_02900 [Methanosarcinales archaeon]|nr:hypothetical protein [Methanosarcinales archaeon]
MKIVFCIDCDIDIEIGPLQHGTLRCEDCKVKRQARLAAKSQRERQAKYKSKKGPRCHCGCGRPKDKNLSLLSRYCYKRFSGNFEGSDEELLYDDYKGGWDVNKVIPEEKGRLERWISLKGDGERRKS